MKKYSRLPSFLLVATAFFSIHIGLVSAQEGEEIALSDTRYSAVSISDVAMLDFADKSGLSVSVKIKNIFSESRAYQLGIEFRGISEVNNGELFVWRQPDEIHLEGGSEQSLSFVMTNPQHLSGKYRITLGMNDRHGNVVAMVSLGEKEFFHTGRVNLEHCTLSGDESGRGVIQMTQAGILGTCEVVWDGAEDGLARIMTRIVGSRYGMPKTVGQSDTVMKSDTSAIGNVLISEAVDPGIYQLEIVPVAAAGYAIGLPIKKTLIVAGKGGKLKGVTRFESGKSFSPKETVTATALLDLYDNGKYELLLELLSQGQSCATPIRASIEGQTNVYEGEFTVTANCAMPEVRATLSADGKQIDQLANGSNDMSMREEGKKGMIGQAPHWALWGGVGVLAMLLLYVLTKRRARTNRVMMPIFFLCFSVSMFLGFDTKQVEAGSASAILECNGGCGPDTYAVYNFTTDKNSYSPGETITVSLELQLADQVRFRFASVGPMVRLGLNGGSFTGDLVLPAYSTMDIENNGGLFLNISRSAPMTAGPFTLTIDPQLSGYEIEPLLNIPLSVAVALPAPTVTLDPFSPGTITAGNSATISLSTSNATSCSGDAGSLWTGNLGATNFSNMSTGPMSAGSYTQRVTCTGPGGSTSSVTRTLTVNAAPAATGSFTSTPSCIIATGAAGCNVTVDWTTSNTSTATLTNCGDVYLDSISSGPRSTPGVYVPYNSGCFRIHNGGTAGPILAQNTFNSSCTSGTSWNGSSCQAAGVNGICGFANGRTYDVNNSVIPVVDRCSSGTYNVVTWGSDGGAFYTTTNFDGLGMASTPGGAQAAYYLGRTWSCDGSGGGLTRGCRLYYQPRCGSANATTLSSAPGSSSTFEKIALCEIGTAGPVTTTASAYSWSCTNGSGPTANCSANRSGGVPGVTGQITASVVQYSLEEQSWWQKVLAFITGRDHEALATGAPASITTTGTARIDWNTSSATSCQVSGPGMTTSNSTTGNRSLNGSTLGAGTHTYTLNCTGNNGSTLNDSAQVIVSSSGGTGGCCGTSGGSDDVPTGLNAFPSSCGTGTLNISWNSVSGATSYQLRDNGVQIYTGSSTSFTHSGLSASSSHSYTVRSTGGSGSSAYSSPANQTAPSSCVAICGNGTTESPEECDTGGARGACPATCSNSCTTNTCSVVSDGVCGWANLGSFASTPPASGLCTSGTPSVVNNNGNFWTWSCESMSGGATPACWASVAGGGSGLCGNWAIDPGEQCDNGIVNGMCPSSCSNSCTNNSCGMFGAPPQCASTHYNCTEGWPTNSFNGATAWSWRCEKTGFTDAVCTESKTASGSITAVNSCTIPVGSAMCNGSISWTTANASNPVLEVAGGSPAQVYGPVGNNQTITLGYGSHSVTLRDVNIGVTYDTDTMSASCVTGSAWSSITLRCEPAPIVTLTVNGSSGPVSAAPGDTLSLDWTVSGATSCTASGKWSGSKSVTGGTESTTAAVPSGDYVLTCTNGAGMTTIRQVTVNLACTASTTPWSACGPPCAGGNGTRSRTITTGACIVTTQSESCTTSTCRDLNWKEVGQ